jgi:hypothetical protein
VTLSVIILVVALAVAVAVGYFTRNRLSPRPALFAVLGAIAVIVGAWLVVWDMNQIIQARQVRHWPTVTGTVIESAIIGDRAIRPLIIYRYQVASQEYTDSSSLGIPSFGNRMVRRDESEKLTAEYRAGDSVAVHYNPADPRQSLLYTREEWSSYQRVSLGVLLFALGVFLVTRWGLGFRSA